MPRETVTAETEIRVLIRSRRRCALCYKLEGDLARKEGQIAHVDRDNENSAFSNLAFLCLPHHNAYDSRPSQAKAFKPGELTSYRDDLYEHIESGACLQDPPKLPSIGDGQGCSVEVYQLRIPVFRAVRAFLSRIVQEAAVEREEVRTLAHSTVEALFLFGPDIEGKVGAMIQKAVRFRRVAAKLKRLIDEHAPLSERVPVVDEDIELLEWFDDTLRNLPVIFYPYLRLGPGVRAAEAEGGSDGR